MTTVDFAMRLEGYMISDVDGVITNYAQGIVDLKKKLAELIHSKLDTTAGYHIPKIIYTNFDH
ncbi:hypothetical protein FA13DRAFT_1797178 [Coprinellus micaceus]|uniref:Uncharacterized protein n=1 Tax=Coprinellus micaceus TaxID=71717 RepID=A0A4Y7SS32_COPMI|nr:hypothetical protein FA13DRAFT_1801639 [Coprinellus micaceus]TEB24448.1 hypothetical protein FA13DRAFT_1797178 [Coprinellus micaceus]